MGRPRPLINRHKCRALYAQRNATNGNRSMSLFLPIEEVAGALF